MSPQLPTRALGKNGPQVTAIGIGLMSLAGAYGPRLPDEERLAFLDSVYNAGERFWDTADIYADSEDIVGRWLELHPERRSEIFLATKFGSRVYECKFTADSSPEYCKEAVEKSLVRLAVEYIDLYYCHRVDGVTPIEDTMCALAELQAEGKIKYIGLSEVSATTLRRATKVAHVDAVQLEYSPWSLDIEHPDIGLLNACRELGIAVVAYSPLGRGMLSGHIRSIDDLTERDPRRSMPRFSPLHFDQNLVLVKQLVEFAKKKSITTTQLVLAWLLAQDEAVIPIPGTTKARRLEENLGAFEVQLSTEEVAEIRYVVDNAAVEGARYAESHTKYLLGDTPLRSNVSDLVAVQDTT